MLRVCQFQRALELIEHEKVQGKLYLKLETYLTNKLTQKAKNQTFFIFTAPISAKSTGLYLQQKHFTLQFTLIYAYNHVPGSSSGYL